MPDELDHEARAERCAQADREFSALCDEYHNFRVSRFDDQKVVVCLDGDFNIEDLRNLMEIMERLREDLSK